MSTQRFTPEFKEVAVKQITERGHKVAEVPSRLGVSQPHRACRVFSQYAHAREA